MLTQYCQGEEGEWFKTMIAGSSVDENTYQNTDFQKNWFSTNLMWLQVFLQKVTYHVFVELWEQGQPT